MLINVEFFDEDPIENVVTSLHYKMDKTIFFGYKDGIEKRKKDVAAFLKKYCGVKEVEFYEVLESNLKTVVDRMRDCLEKEIAQGNQLFFDLTGGESLLLVAFGFLARDYHAPMHMYDIDRNELFEYGTKDALPMSQAAEYQPVKLNLDGFISLYGGKINYAMHKDVKALVNQEHGEDVVRMWEISRKYHKKWLHYSALLRSLKYNETDLTVHMPAHHFLGEKKKNPALGSADYFYRFLKDCEKEGLIKDRDVKDGNCTFTYKNDRIKDYFWDGGSILEMYTYTKVQNQYPKEDCRVGVHIDWDGEIRSGGMDVLNEIDVMAMDHNLPVFISCKIGNVNQTALYELDTVAGQFGGKYAKKILAVAKPLSPGHQLRAQEMGIEVWHLK